MGEMEKIGPSKENNMQKITKGKNTRHGVFPGVFLSGKAVMGTNSRVILR